jgi:hypothetical protein
VFAYGETKKLREEQYRIEGRIDQLVAATIDQSTRLREVERTYGSAETLRWAVGEITKLEKRMDKLASREAAIDDAAKRWGAGTIENLQKRIKTLEDRTQPPAGLEPVKAGGRRIKGQRVPGGIPDRILDALKSAGRPMTAQEIAAAVGTHNGHWWQLRRMDERGEITRLAKGLYALPQDTYGGHASRYVEAATLQCARSAGQNGRG